MQHNGYIYAYIDLYINGLEIMARDTKILMEDIKNRYTSKLQGTGPIEFHLGYYFFYDSNVDL